MDLLLPLGVVAGARVATSLVLFLDASNLDIDGLRRDRWVPALTLGPGT